MTQSVYQAELTLWRFLFGWGNWTPPSMPAELNVVDRWDGPWRDTTNGRKVDLDRTAALADVDMPVTINAGKKPHQGTSYGYPINVADRARRVPVRNLSTTSKAGDEPEVHLLPLPKLIRIEGDPAGAFDRHLKLVDPISMVCWEAIQAHVIEHSHVNVGYSGSGDGLTRWDMSRRWTTDDPGRGVVAANVPHTPLLARRDEVPGGIHHVLPLVMPAYSDDDPVGWARATDGEDPRHPLRAGDIIKLTCVAWIRLCERFAVGTPERAIADALFTYGAMVIDKTPGKAASISLTQDRFWAGLRDMELRLGVHFEVLAA